MAWHIIIIIYNDYIGGKVFYLGSIKSSLEKEEEVKRNM